MDKEEQREPMRGGLHEAEGVGGVGVHLSERFGNLA